MSRKIWPVIIMLFAGAVISIITFVRGLLMHEKLLWLLITLIVFYGMGCLLVRTLDYFDKVNEKKRQEEQKEAAEENNTEDESTKTK